MVNYCDDVVQTYYATRRSSDAVHYCDVYVQVKYDYSLGTLLAPATTIWASFGGLNKLLSEGASTSNYAEYKVTFQDSELDSQMDLFTSMLRWLRGWTAPKQVSLEDLKMVNGECSQFFDVKRVDETAEASSSSTTHQGEQPDLTYLLKPASYWLKVNDSDDWININMGTTTTFSEMTDRYVEDNPDMAKYNNDIFNTATDNSMNYLSINHDNLKSQKIKYTIKYSEYLYADIS